MYRSFIKALVEHKPFFIAYAFILLSALSALYLLPADQVFFSVNTLRNSSLDAIATILTWYGQGEFQVFFLLYLLLIPFFRNKRYVLTAAAYGVLITLVNFALKSYFDKPRPLSVYGLYQINTVKGMPNHFWHSFPSGHTAGAFAMFTFILLLIPKKHIAIQLLFLLIACGTAYSRMYLGQHFFEDVIAGTVVGISVGLPSFYIGKRLSA